jgi:hypothetical protein
MSLTPAERSQRARLAALSRHAQSDGKESTRKATEASWARFERQVDPEGRLSPKERRRRAKLAERAHMTRLALASAQARRIRRALEDGQ